MVRSVALLSLSIIPCRYLNRAIMGPIRSCHNVFRPCLLLGYGRQDRKAESEDYYELPEGIFVGVLSGGLQPLSTISWFHLPKYFGPQVGYQGVSWSVVRNRRNGPNLATHQRPTDEQRMMLR